MCRRTTCRTCGKASWAGCGAHVDQVLAGVPESERCSCTPEDKQATQGPGLLSRLFNR